MPIHFNPSERKMSKEKLKFLEKLERVWEGWPASLLDIDISMASIIGYGPRLL
jgi:hypothetical protein